jgi:O-antigen/teichoic acid export membrane protein
MIMARILSKNDLAAYRQTLLAYMVVAPFLQMGVSHALYYFLPNETHRIRGRVVDSICILGFTGVLFALFMAFGGNQLLAQKFSNPRVGGLLLWMIPYAIVTTPASLVSTVLVTRDKAILASVFVVVKQLLVGAGTVIPLLMWENAEAPLVGNVTASVILGIVSIGLMIRSTPSDNGKPSGASIAEMTKFALPLGVATMVSVVALQLDKIIVGMMCSAEDFATYALGAMEVPFIGVITGSITMVMLVEMRKHVSAGERMEALQLFHRVAEKSAYVLLPVMCFFLVTADCFMQLLYGIDYAESAYAFRFYLLLLPIRCVVFGSLLISLGKNAFILKRSLLDLTVNGFLSVMMVSYMGPKGAVIATVTTIYLWTVPSNLLCISRAIGVSAYSVLPLRKMVSILVILLPLVCLSLLAVYLLRDASNLSVFLTVSFLFASFLIFWWNGKLYSIDKIRAKFS